MPRREDAVDVVHQGIYAGSGKWLEELMCEFSQGVNPTTARRVNFIRLSVASIAGNKGPNKRRSTIMEKAPPTKPPPG